MCQRKPHQFLISQATGLIIPAHCKAYCCPECGQVKIKKLQRAIELQITVWKQIRFWTFTLSNRVGGDKKDHYLILRECWRRFINNIRRTKVLRASIRAFQYIKVVEQHKSGYIHFHVFVSEYLPQSVVAELWKNVCQEVTGYTTHISSAFVKLVPNAKVASKYVCKYVMKQITITEEGIRKYSKSGGIILFPVKISVNEWFFLRTMQMHVNDLLDEICEISPLLVSSQHNFPVKVPDSV